MANLAPAADFHPVHDHRVFDLAVAVNSHVSSNHAVVHMTAADDRSFRNHRVDRHSLAIAPIEDKLRWWVSVPDRAQRPTPVVKIEGRIDGAKIHARFIIGIDGSEITPVARLFALRWNWHA